MPKAPRERAEETQNEDRNDRTTDEWELEEERCEMRKENLTAS